MNTVNIGLIGGCLATLNDVKKSELFFNLIKKDFQDKIKFRFKLGSYNNLSEIDKEFKRIQSKDKIEILILQIRPYIFLKNCRFYLRIKNKISCNPLIFDKKNFIAIEELEEKLKNPLHLRLNNYIVKNEKNNFFKKFFSIYNINLLFGILFRLNKALENYYIFYLNDLKRYCYQKGIKLIIHGPVNRTAFGLEPSILKSLTEKLESSNLSDIYSPTIEKNFKGHSVLFFDGEHINKFGHKLIAKKLNAKIRNLLLN